MSVNVHGLVGTVSWAPHDVPKRGVSPRQIEQAQVWREAGRGWQTIAKILGVNVIDLRAACKDPGLDPAFRTGPADGRAPKDDGRVGSRGIAPGAGSYHRASRTHAETDERRHRVLAAIGGWCGSPSEVAERLGLEMRETYGPISSLRQAGKVEGDGRNGCLHLTDAGRAELEGAAS